MFTRRASAVAAAVAVVAALFPLSAAQAGPTEYIEVSDGTLIAINVRFPDGKDGCFGIENCKDVWKGRNFPTLFEMSGYDGGSADGDTPGGAGGAGSRGISEPWNDDYITIHASVRGSGCSSGEFDLFSSRSALDGAELIEWINDQPWSDGKIAIYGHSYGGITGTMIASMQPPSLDAITTSGLIDDLYRGIVYPGGVSNYGFPLLWTGAIRNVYDIGGGSVDGAVENQDAQCGANTAGHRRTVVNDPILQGLADTDNDWFRARSLINYIHKIEVPAHFTGAYQDEQTGPRGPWNLFDHLPSNIPSRLVQTNGDHGTQTNRENQADRKAWTDHFLGVDPQPGRFGPVKYSERDPHRSVVTRFENHNPPGDDTPEGSRFEIVSSDWPLPETRWDDLYLRGDGKLTPSKPAKDEGSSSYFSGSGRQSWSYQAGHTPGSPVTTADGPDELTFATQPFKEDTAIVGPITATLFASTTSPDDEFFVQLIDEAPDGSRYYLTRGMLKASHRAITKGRSDRITDGPRRGTIYRPHRPHTNPTNVTPGEVNEYLVEVFPVGHLLRKGHRLIVKFHAPPAVDSYYIYIPKRVPGAVTILHDAKHPSSVMLPFVPLRGIKIPPPLDACALQDVRCVP